MADKHPLKRKANDSDENKGSKHPKIQENLTIEEKKSIQEKLISYFGTLGIVADYVILSPKSITIHCKDPITSQAQAKETKESIKKLREATAKSCIDALGRIGIHDVLMRQEPPLLVTITGTSNIEILRKATEIAQLAPEIPTLEAEAREKQKLEDEAKEKKRQEDQAREKQRLEDEAKEKKKQEDEAREKKILEDEEKKRQVENDARLALKWQKEEDLASSAPPSFLGCFFNEVKSEKEKPITEDDLPDLLEKRQQFLNQLDNNSNNFDSATREEKEKMHQEMSPWASKFLDNEAAINEVIKTLPIDQQRAFIITSTPDEIYNKYEALIAKIDAARRSSFHI